MLRTTKLTPQKEKFTIIHLNWILFKVVLLYWVCVPSYLSISEMNNLVKFST